MGHDFYALGAPVGVVPLIEFCSRVLLPIGEVFSLGVDHGHPPVLSGLDQLRYMSGWSWKGYTFKVNRRFIRDRKENVPHSALLHRLAMLIKLSGELFYLFVR